MLIIEREDGSTVAAFSRQGFAKAAVERAAWEDFGEARPFPPPGCCSMDASDHPEPNRRGETPVRVLVAFEDVRAAYREAIAHALGELRPNLEVRQAPLAEIHRKLRSFDPHVVVCSRRDGESPGGRGAWVQVPTEDEAGDDEQLAQLCPEGERWNTEGPTLGEILDVIDETRRRLRERGLAATC